ncbi:hypothetical protein [Halomicronema sp. CCY15110]|uniref:hypothetical protein n=1 Tax=Halomicronema sp. CCY15110 TaxID=2767773 RepID=UPI00194FDC22|nr:hypothetical protein [Halomicronema sp. CCY15110]
MTAQKKEEELATKNIWVFTLISLFFGGILGCLYTKKWLSGIIIYAIFFSPIILIIDAGAPVDAVQGACVILGFIASLIAYIEGAASIQVAQRRYPPKPKLNIEEKPRNRKPPIKETFSDPETNRNKGLEPRGYCKTDENLEVRILKVINLNGEMTIGGIMMATELSLENIEEVVGKLATRDVLGFRNRESDGAVVYWVIV